MRFNQPNASSITLNRVTGPEASNIMGSLTANGKVFILNPNGVLIGAGAQVNVGGLVASTNNLSNADFMAGNFNFKGNGSGSVENQGNINIAEGGMLAFIAPVIKNTGTINADQGKVLLAAADDVTLTMLDGNMVSYTLNKGSVQTLIDNGGLIQADGGQVILTAKGQDALSKSVINHSGIIEAQTVSNKNGVVELLGDMQVGELNVSGKLDASAPTTGDGGFVETSAAKVNIAANTQVTTKADSGDNGTWLIDPTDFNIDAGNGAQTTSGIGATTLSTNLNNGNVSISTSSAGAGNGDINVNSAVSWAASTFLELNAHGDININAPITATGNNAGLGLYPGLGVAGGDYYINAGGKVTLSGNAAIFNTDGVGWTLIHTANELQNISDNINGAYALGNDIDLSTIPNFVPISDSTEVIYAFGGFFEGFGHKITSLNINSSSPYGVGLFAANAGIIRNVALIDVNVYGSSFYTGGLVGYNGGFIGNSSTIGAVNGASTAGGLVGYNDDGVITQSYSTAYVSSTGGGAATGGLVGLNSGTISESYATGDIKSAGYAGGGLVGDNDDDGIISNTYASGYIDVDGHAGGLVGNNDGGISNSYSVAAVREAETLSAGGLVGNYGEFGPATSSYWNTQSSGLSTSAGGAGKTTAEMQQQSTFVGWDFDNVWRISPGDYPRLRALTQGTITVDPTALGLVAPNVAKVYDGVGVNAVHDLAALPGWDGGAFAIGLIDNDTLTDTSIFTGTLSYDGTWLGARNAGQYSIIPTGLSSQKYEIQYGEGTLFIVPRVLDVAVTKTANGNATFNTGYTIINNTKIAGDIVNVTGTATVASANAGVYNSFVSNNLVTDNPNYTVNPVNTDDYEYTGTGQVVATIQSVNTPSVEPTEPTKQGEVVQPLSFNPNNPVTTVNTQTATLNSTGNPVISFSLDAPPTTTMTIASYVAPAPNEAITNKTIVGVLLKKPSTFSLVDSKAQSESYYKGLFDKALYNECNVACKTLIGEVESNTFAVAFGQIMKALVDNKILKKTGVAKLLNPEKMSKEVAKKLYKDATKIDFKDMGKGLVVSFIGAVIGEQLLNGVNKETYLGVAETVMVKQAVIIAGIVGTGGNVVSGVIAEAQFAWEQISELSLLTSEVSSQRKATLTNVADAYVSLAKTYNKAILIDDPVKRDVLLKVVSNGKDFMRNEVVSKIGDRITASLGIGVKGEALSPAIEILFEAKIANLNGDTARASKLVADAREMAYGLGGFSTKDSQSPAVHVLNQLINNMGLSGSSISNL